MRQQFINYLTKLKDPKVILIVGDVGYNFVEPFAKKFPNQFLNCGIMEPTMIGVAAGMAKDGWKPYVYTMTNFLGLKCYEQIRNDICIPNLPVTLVGVSGGGNYKFLGYSHNLLFDDEDTRLLAPLPNMSLYTPDDEGLDGVMKQIRRANGPAYLKL